MNVRSFKDLPEVSDDEVQAFQHGASPQRWRKFQDQIAQRLDTSKPVTISHGEEWQLYALGTSKTGKPMKLTMLSVVQPTADEEAAKMDEYKESEKAVAVSPFQVIEAADFAGADYVEPDWQVHQLVPKIGSGLDIGESMTWKSFKIFDLAACIHRGVQWRDRPTRKGRAVIVVAEGVHGYPLRMKAYAKAHGCKVSDLPAIIPAAPNLFDPQQVTQLIAELKKRGATYVALDTKWRCSMGAEENSAKDNAIVFGSIDRIAREVGCFCTAISHVGKDPSKGVRGSSSQFAAVDVEVLHERLGDVGTAKITKLKDGPDGAQWTVRTKFVSLGESKKTGEEYGSLVIEHTADNMAQRNGMKLPRVGTQIRVAYDTIKDLLALEGGPISISEAFEAIKDKKLEPEPGKPDRRGQRATDEIEALIAQRLIFKTGKMLTDNVGNAVEVQE